MNRSVKSALKATIVLVCISAVCVGLLAVCNKFFPKYVPTLDEGTAGLINSVCPTGTDDKTAFDDGYIVMLYEEDYGASIDEFNKNNKAQKAQILCVYGEVKGENTGAYIVESSATGRDSDIMLLTAYRDGAIVGATVKKQNESYWAKLAGDLFDSVKGEAGDVDLKGELGKTGATISLSAIERALNLSNDFSAEFGSAIRNTISEKTKDAVLSGEKDGAREAVHD